MVDHMKVGFVCVENAGRSQIAEAVAATQLQIQERDDIEIHSGGTDPADKLHPVVVDVMTEKGYDLSNQSPQKITGDELATFDIVALMGCVLSVADFPTGVVVRDWGFITPTRGTHEEVRAISTEIEHRVIELLNDLPTTEDRQATLNR